MYGITNVMDLGKVNQVSDDALLGQVGCHKDLNYAAAGRIKPELSQHLVFARLCRNESSGTLAAGTVVRGATDATYGPLKATAGAAAIGSDHVPIGVVDPWVSAAVPDNAFFWLIYYGPCKFLFTTGTTIAVNDLLTLGAAGRAVKYDPASADAEDSLFRLGRTLEAVDTAIADDTLFRGFADFRF